MQPHSKRTFFVIVFLLLTALPAHTQKFFQDDPIWNDDDTLPIEKPTEVEFSQVYDFSENTFVRTRDKKNSIALNINTLGEVPDSSWFNNRMGKKIMSLEELMKGPDRGTGPDLSKPWTVTRAKTQGISPGFVIKDALGDTYFVKFDPKEFPQLNSSTEVIGTKFFYAFGYNTAENFVVVIRPDQLVVSPDAKITDEEGLKRKMSQKDIESTLKRVAINEDGSIQVVASARIPGESLGPHKYYDIRKDDPNDIFPHQYRRDLRGLRVFSAWLNHDDSRSINTYDAFEKTDRDKGYVKHYLLDFSSTFGSGSVKPQTKRAGNEYIIEWGPIFKSACSFGLIDRSWRKVKYPYYEYLGRYEAEYYHPAKWKPEYPNPAFDRMDDEDAFWATRIAMRFNDEMVRAIVSTGQIRNKEAENYLIETIKKRRDKTVGYYLSLMNPLDEFQLEGDALRFVNLGERAGIGKAEAYEYQWFRFDSNKSSLDPIGQVQTSTSASVPVPVESSPFLMVRIKTKSSSQPNWNEPVDIYFRNGSERTIVGIERSRS